MTEELKFAFLADVDNQSISAPTLRSIINQISLKGEIIYGKIYGYSDRKNKEIGDIINANGYDSCTPVRNKKKGKGVVDTRIFIDAVELACLNQNIDAFCILAGNGDLVPLFAKLKSFGVYLVYGGNAEDDNAALCNEIISVEVTEGLTKSAKFSVEKKAETPKVKTVTRPTYISPVVQEPKYKNSDPTTYEQINSVVAAERVVKDLKEGDGDVFFEIERLVKDFIKGNEKE